MWLWRIKQGDEGKGDYLFNPRTTTYSDPPGQTAIRQHE